MHASTGNRSKQYKSCKLKKCEGGFKGNIKKIIDVLAECGGEMEYEELKSK